VSIYVTLPKIIVIIIIIMITKIIIEIKRGVRRQREGVKAATLLITDHVDSGDA